MLVCIITIQANNSQPWESKAEKISIIKSPHTNIAFPTEVSSKIDQDCLPRQYVFQSIHISSLPFEM